MNQLYNIQIRMNKTLIFFAVTAILMLDGSSLDWQGVGNMSQQNMTVIRDYINANFSASWTGDTLKTTGNTLAINFTTAFSTQLNRRWDPAWNVFLLLILNPFNGDSVVYGYAFRNHWLWINGVRLGTSYFISFIIWKDYNCIKWYSFDANSSPLVDNTFNRAPTGIYSSSIQPILASVASINPSGANVWDAVYTYGSTFATSPPLLKMSFTLIASENGSVNFYGRFCAQDYALTGYVGNYWGRLFLIQTR